MNASISNTQELKIFLEKAKVDKDYYSIYPDENFTSIQYAIYV